MSPVTGRPDPVFSVPAGWLDTHSAGPVIARVTDLGDVSRTAAVGLERIVWIELPLRLAEAPWPVGAPLDVVLEDPAKEAAGLYALDRVRHDHPLRVTIPGRLGLARSARIAMALRLPVRLLTLQPSAQALAELEEVLELYLHDSGAAAPAEFLQSALAWWLFGKGPSPWLALELDPDLFPRLGVGEPSAPLEPGFVQQRLTRLVQAGGECAACRFCDWCQGFFKWPAPVYPCAGVARLLRRVEESAAQLSRDLVEARALEP